MAACQESKIQFLNLTHFLFIGNTRPTTTTALASTARTMPSRPAQLARPKIARQIIRARAVAFLHKMVSQAQLVAHHPKQPHRHRAVRLHHKAKARPQPRSQVRCLLLIDWSTSSRTSKLTGKASAASLPADQVPATSSTASVCLLSARAVSKKKSASASLVRPWSN